MLGLPRVDEPPSSRSPSELRSSRDTRAAPSPKSWHQTCASFAPAARRPSLAHPLCPIHIYLSMNRDHPRVVSARGAGDHAGTAQKRVSGLIKTTIQGVNRSIVSLCSLGLPRLLQSNRGGAPPTSGLACSSSSSPARCPFAHACQAPYPYPHPADG